MFLEASRTKSVQNIPIYFCPLTESFSCFFLVFSEWYFRSFYKFAGSIFLDPLDRSSKIFLKLIAGESRSAIRPLKFLLDA